MSPENNTKLNNTIVVTDYEYFRKTMKLVFGAKSEYMYNAQRQ